MADKWTQALDHIAAQRDHDDKVAQHERLAREAAKRERELAEIRSLMR